MEQLNITSLEFTAVSSDEIITLIETEVTTTRYVRVIDELVTVRG